VLLVYIVLMFLLSEEKGNCLNLLSLLISGLDFIPCHLNKLKTILPIFRVSF